MSKLSPFSAEFIPTINTQLYEEEYYHDLGFNNDHNPYPLESHKDEDSQHLHYHLTAYSFYENNSYSGSSSTLTQAERDPAFKEKQDLIYWYKNAVEYSLELNQDLDGVEESEEVNSVVESLFTQSSKSSCSNPQERRLEQRQKQIDYGKNTIGYIRYLTAIPKNSRKFGDPQTPEKYSKCSKRSWDGLVRSWRRKLHTWDPPPL